MKSLSLHCPWRSLVAAFLVPLLAFLLACGPGEEPTPIPTSTPTQAPAATPTSALPGPVASPTPTSVATPTSTPSEQPKYGGRYLLLSNLTPANFDGHSSINELTRIGPLLYSNLFINTEGQQVECEICTDWHLEDGGKTMVFNMIQGIKYHDGQEMVSADVAYSIRKIMGEIDGVISPRAGVIKEYITSVETPSRYQLKIHMVRPSAFVPKVLSFGWSSIFPDGTTRAMLKEKPYGSGPYLLKDFKPGAAMTFDRNPSYFKQGLPYLDGVDFVVVGDETTRNASFLIGKTLNLNPVAPQLFPQLKQMLAEGKLNMEITQAGCGWPHVGWANHKPPFTEKKVRQAINLSIDRVAMAAVTHEEYSSPQLMYYMKGQEWATPEEKIWNVVPGWGTGAKKQQEIEEGKKLLAEAGFPNGIDIEQIARTPFLIYYNPEAVQQQLGKIGFRTKLKLIDNPTQLQRMANLDYLIQTFQFCIPTADPDEVVGTYLITGGSRNWFGYSNPEVDRLFPLMSGELDPQKRKELVFKIQDIVVLQDVAYAPMQRTATYNWWWKSLKGVRLGMDGFTSQVSTGWARLDRVWIDK